jgi:hypothetical protein
MKGGMYEVLGEENGMIRVIDETEDDYLYFIKRDEQCNFLPENYILINKIQNVNKKCKLFRLNRKMKVFLKKQSHMNNSKNTLGKDIKEIVQDSNRSKWLMGPTRKFYVRRDIVLAQTEYYIKKDTEIRGIVSIAEGSQIRCVDRLINEYSLSTDKKSSYISWYKMRGTAIITNGTLEKKAEVHWYQCENIGKVEFKIKRFLI